VNLFYRIMLGGLRTAHRAAGNRRLRLRIRRAAMILERQLEV